MPAAAALLLIASLVQAEPPRVTFLSGAELLRAIRTAPEEQPPQPGLYSLRLSGPSEYPVIGICRRATGMSELHHQFTDVWYVLEGSATLVTGGSLVEGLEIRPGEIRGRSISGGNARVIRGGDFAVIPAGVPHWVSEVSGKELLYLVVKVPSGSREENRDAVQQPDAADEVREGKRRGPRR